ncbi:MAG: hypothetical protein GF311_15300 [Candidatus Lokiarchaeota archaeon]|nr:hypothetical protein [Candidatus Lokiarchaeota archaeon]
MIKKSYELKWTYNAPEAILACAIINCHDKTYLVFGGHDRHLYIMNEDKDIINSMEFDGWLRCIYTADIDGDGCEEIIAGTGDGNFLVVKYREEDAKLIGVKHYITDGKVLCCTAGDITRNGQHELIFGGDNNKLIIFANFSSDFPQFVQYYESWVTSCTTGVLKPKSMKSAILGLVVGTKNGLLQLIHIEDQNLKILWHRDLDGKLNDIYVADINHDGFNEIITCSDDSNIRVFNSEGDLLTCLHITESRPLSLLIDDIDGDNANELIIGCADGSLFVYQNNQLDSLNFKLKWSTKIKSSIEDIASIAKDDNSIKQIIFGGYDRTIRNVVDFEWGKRKKLEIPPPIELPNVRVKEEEAFSSIPTNLEEFIQNLLEERIYIDLNILIEDLEEIGYDMNKIEEKLNALKMEGNLLHKEEELSVWRLIQVPNEREFVEEASKEDFEIKPKDKFQVKSKGNVKTFATLQKVIFETLNQKGPIDSKSDLIDLVSQKGFSKTEIQSEIDILNDKNLITYSRSKPRGWTLNMDLQTEQGFEEKKASLQEKKTKIEEDILSLFKKQKIFYTKSELVDAIASSGYKRDQIKDIIGDLNKRGIIEYSRSKPRGWRLLSA